ncbi:MAG TPA: hypothetical protein VF941_12640 [Clostridia bacterium]
MMTLVLLSACGYSNTGRMEIQKDGKKITLLNSKTPLANDFGIEKIDKYEGIRGEDWLGDNSILITRENQELEPIHIFDQMSLIRNLYSYDMKSKEEKSMAKKSDYVWMPIMSPDGRYIFFEKSNADRSAWVITDLEGNEKATVEEDTAKGFRLHTNGAMWVNNEEVVVPFSNDGVLLININSKVSKIEAIGQMQTDSAAKVDDKIYYISTERNLVVYDISSKKSKVVKENVLDFELSPEKDMFAIQKKISESRNALVLIGLSGSEKDTLTEAKAIFGISWSPDQSKLAYLMTSEDESKTGLHLIDLKSKEDIYVSRDFLNVDNGLKWSPSGKKILASIGDIKDMKVIDNTYVISLK